MAVSKTNIFLKGISVTTVFTISSGVLGLVYFSLMSRLLTKDDFGYFAALTGIMTIVSSLADAGLGASVIQKKDATSKYISTAFSLSFILGLSGMFLIFALAPFIARLVADDYLTLPLRVMSATLLINSFVSVGNAQLYREFKYTRIGTISFISNVLAITISILMAYKGMGLFSMIAYVALVPLFTAVQLYLTSVKIPKLTIEKKYIKDIVSFGGWLTLSSILNKTATYIDRIFLPRLTSVQTLGAYTRPASFVSQITGHLTDIFDKVAFPILSEIQDDKEHIKSIFYRCIELLNIFSIVLAVIFFFNAELIITIFFGNDWLSLKYVLQILSVTMIFKIDSQLADCFFRSLNLVKIGFYIQAGAVIWNLVCIVIGCRYGLTGIAVSLSFASISITLFRLVVLGHKINASYAMMLIRWIKSWKPALIPISVGLLFCFLPSSTGINILEAIVMGITIIIEFVYFPAFIGKEYEIMAQPIIEKVFKRIK